MESRGNDTGRKPAISRRSCDQCRARKIACDRGSPCSNCSNARVECTHSTIATRNSAAKAKQTSNNPKLDEIASAVDGIKQLLQGLNLSSRQQSHPSSISASNHVTPTHLQDRNLASFPEGDTPLKNHSVPVCRFVNDVVEDGGLKNHSLEPNDVLDSLREFALMRDERASVRAMASSETLKNSSNSVKTTAYMPVLEAAIFILRWARDHQGYYRVSWLTLILPLETFTKICQKLYFAIDDYTDTDFIISNGLLHWLFAEHAIITGSDEYLEYSIQCQENIQNGIGRLSLLLQPTMESTAALLVGALYAIENANASLAWTLSSLASNFCITLGYHQLAPASDTNSTDLTISKETQLFWTVYAIDKGLSFRFSRASIIRDSEITTLPLVKESQCTKVCRIQGKVYELLLSPMGLLRREEERRWIAEGLADEVRDVIRESRQDKKLTMEEHDAFKGDRMRAVYIRIELSIQISLLAMILNLSGSTKRSVAAACDALDVHEKCVQLMYDNAPFMKMKYTNWAIIHTPFIPFIILFNHSIQFSNLADLSRLESFTSSLQPGPPIPESAARPHRLFQLLCQVARLYIDSNTALNGQRHVDFDGPEYLSALNLPDFGMEMDERNGMQQVFEQWCHDDMGLLGQDPVL